MPMIEGIYEKEMMEVLKPMMDRVTIYVRAQRATLGNFQKTFGENFKSTETETLRLRIQNIQPYAEKLARLSELMASLSNATIQNIDTIAQEMQSIYASIQSTQITATISGQNVGPTQKELAALKNAIKMNIENKKRTLGGQAQSSSHIEASTQEQVSNTQTTASNQQDLSNQRPNPVPNNNVVENLYEKDMLNVLKPMMDRVTIYVRSQRAILGNFQKTFGENFKSTETETLRLRIQNIQPYAEKLARLSELMASLSTATVQNIDTIAQEMQSIYASIQSVQITAKMGDQSVGPTPKELMELKNAIKMNIETKKRSVGKQTQNPNQQPQQSATSETQPEFTSDNVNDVPTTDYDIQDRKDKISKYQELKKKYDSSGIFGKTMMRLRGQANFEELERELGEEVTHVK